ncbi:MAG: type II toxin-antitoxin system VapC family toxin [Acidobacteriota bacterium]
MIAVDTNLLVRFFTRDDPEQFQKAVSALEAADTIFVSTTVFLELEWLLRYTYKLEASEIHEAIQGFLSNQKVVVANRLGVLQASRWAAEGLDFADALHWALSNRAREFLTFDRRFARRAGRIDARPPVRAL